MADPPAFIIGATGETGATGLTGGTGIPGVGISGPTGDPGFCFNQSAGAILANRMKIG